MSSLLLGLEKHHVGGFTLFFGATLFLFTTFSKKKKKKQGAFPFACQNTGSLHGSAHLSRTIGPRLLLRSWQLHLARANKLRSRQSDASRGFRVRSGSGVSWDRKTGKKRRRTTTARGLEVFNPKVNFKGRVSVGDHQTGDPTGERRGK